MRVEVLVALMHPPVPVPSDDVTIVDNPTGSIPDGLNGALRESQGSIIVRVDSRCDLPAHYVARCIDHLADSHVGIVGGAQLVRDAGLLSGAYAIAFNSPLLGPSAYRYSGRSGPIDSPYLGAWRRETLETLGGWDPRLLRNQDNELADRVRALGLRAVYDHELVVGYWANRSLVGLIRHHRDFGRWRRAQSELGQSGLTTRHLWALAAGAVGSLAAGLVLRRASPGARIAATASVYTAASATALFTSRRLWGRRPDLAGPRPGLRSAALAPAVATLIDGAWLSGVAGVARSPSVTGDGSIDLIEPSRTH